jgi:hypothetical protein
MMASPKSIGLTVHQAGRQSASAQERNFILESCGWNAPSGKLVCFVGAEIVAFGTGGDGYYGS